VAEHQPAAGVIGRCAEELRDVGVAAHHPVQNDDVRPLDRGRVRRDVDQATLHRTAEAALRDRIDDRTADEPHP
jgi:hypothetical protein